MVIDVHVHPTGYSLISQDPEERKFRDKVFQRKYDESKLPIAMTGKPSGGNSGGGHDICTGARRQAYREGFRNGYWEGFNDATWGNPGCGGRPTPRTAGGPGPAIAESGCGGNS